MKGLVLKISKGTMLASPVPNLLAEVEKFVSVEEKQRKMQLRVQAQ
jgi:hypothetical protein